MNKNGKINWKMLHQRYMTILETWWIAQEDYTDGFKEKADALHQHYRREETDLSGEDNDQKKGRYFI